MKKLLACFLFSLVFLFVLTSQVSAVERLNFAASSSSSLQTKFKANARDLVQKKLDEKKTELREKMASQTAQFREKRKGQIKERLTKILNILSTNSQRLSGISDKIQARIDKIKARGVDTSAMQTALNGCATSKTALATALADATGKVAVITDNGDADGSAKAALQSVKSAYEATRNYKKCLMNVVSLIRASVPKEGTASAE